MEQNISGPHRVQQLQRLELIGTVASGVAHDLNNQLTVILNHLDFALRDLDPGHPIYGNLTDVQRAASRCVGMTSTLLGFSAKVTPKFQETDLGDLVSETVRLLRRLIPSTVEVTCECAPDLKQIVADATQVQQVLVNLSINARDAMPQGGTLQIQAYNHDEFVVMSVRDTGCGMSEEIRQRIFEPFFSTKRENGGTGLGLAMVSDIVEQHGGFIVLTTQPGRGSCFEVSFPACDSCVAAAPVPVKAAQGSGCVLVADDDEMVRHVAATVLAMRGYRVIEAKDGAEAVRLFEKHAPEIDLLFLDVTMPGLTGPEAAACLEQVSPGVKALFTSGYGRSVKAPFLPKPYTAEDLARRVADLIA